MLWGLSQGYSLLVGGWWWGEIKRKFFGRDDPGLEAAEDLMAKVWKLESGGQKEWCELVLSSHLSDHQTQHLAGVMIKVDIWWKVLGHSLCWALCAFSSQQTPEVGSVHSIFRMRMKVSH